MSLDLFGIGSIVQGVANGASAVLNYKSQQETNKMNERLFHENQDWEEKMWNLNNQYNSPANQRKLLEQAGYSPAALSDSTGVSKGVGSVNTPNMVAPQLNLEGIGQAIDSALRSKQTNIEQQRVDNDYQIGLYDAQTRRLKALSDVNDVNKPTKTEKETNVRRMEADINKTGQEVENMKNQNEYQKTVNKFAEEKQKAELEAAQAWATIQKEAAAVAHDKNQAELTILRITPITQLQQAQAAMRAADASMVNAKANERNSYINEYLADSERDLNIALTDKERKTAKRIVEEIKSVGSYADIARLEADAKKDLGKGYMKTITVVNDVLHGLSQSSEAYLNTRKGKSVGSR